jgi:Spy/CpxP family protein refolding chaperone
MMMRKLAGATLVLSLVCLMSADAALAQGQGGRGGRGGFGGGFGTSPSTLVAIAQVQKELKMTDDQIALVKEMQAANQGAGGQRGRGNNQNQTDAERQERREQAEKRAEERTAKVKALLTDDQNNRLKQIQLWVQGAARVSENADAAKALALTDDQKAAFKAINDESGKKRGELMQKMRGSTPEQRQEITTQVASLRKDTESEAMAVLTDEQKAQFTSLRGEKFELDMSQALQGGGRGGRRRGGNNNNN